MILNAKLPLDITLISFPFSCSTITGSGVDRYTYELYTNLVKLGFPFQLIQKPLGSKLYRYGRVLCVTLPTLALDRAILYHALSPYSFRLSRFFGKRRVVTTVHDVIPFAWTPENPTLFERRRKPYAELAIKKSDFLVVPFEYTKKYIIENFDLDESKVAVVNYGIDLNRFFEAGYCNSKSNEKTKNLLFLGGVNPMNRGGITVLKAFAVASRSDDSLRLTISARRSGLTRLKLEAERLNISNRVTLVDFISEEQLPKFISKFDIFIYPSPMGFSYLMLQVMAVGIPVIASNVFDNPEFIDNSGLTCEQDDIDCFASSILKMVDSDATLSAFKQKSIERAKQFSPVRMAKETLAAYSNFIEDLRTYG